MLLNVTSVRQVEQYMGTIGRLMTEPRARVIHRTLMVSNTRPIPQDDVKRAGVHAEHHTVGELWARGRILFVRTVEPHGPIAHGTP